ncbi:phytoene desaturase family protein [Amycolatopsis pithecellobii]|uniref:Pyridine nucleotide-disulfide oxidoreductase domain-containing protein 2 n=1 Tax=Amycolatopsis pithecellobii TaxID=664692 RepID=A0A6N7Z9W9_9PSEU|nr:NAD(P)/FAD-dependent oxidoreductase [Amycolatopsis pithecellobii]MTD58527.1 NAD(P)-binding protein [Amycolatopsis pithecellobii]
MTTRHYDAIVIGAGHNGLVTANYLARFGKSVLVLEARGVVGGAAVTEELIPGAKWSSCAFIADMIRPEIVADLELRKFGFHMYSPATMGFAMFRDGRHLFLHKRVADTVREIRKHSRADARNFVEWGARLRRFGDYMRPWLLSAPPSRAQIRAEFERNRELDLYRDFFESSTRDLIGGFFENDLIKGFLTFYGMVSVFAGPSTPGTSYVFGHHSSGDFDGEFGVWGFVRGGMGGFTQALADSARHYGVTIRTSARVARVLTKDGRVTGVALDTGEEFTTGVVASNADPVRSVLGLLDPADLDPGLRARIANIDQRGSMARIHLLIDELPAYLGLPAGLGPQHLGHQMLGASVENFEKAWRAEQAGVLAEDYAIEAVIQSATDPTLAPRGLHTLTLGVQQLPGELATEGGWAAAKESWADLIVDRLCDYAPNLKAHILDRHVITPKDLEDEWSLSGGNIFHAAMFDDQLFSGRPVPELAEYATPIEGYYLCGAGTHPGGGVMGASGHNAAYRILQDQALAKLDPPAHIPRARFTDRVAMNRLGRRLAYEVARQPVFDSLLGRITRIPLPGPTPFPSTLDRSDTV